MSMPSRLLFQVGVVLILTVVAKAAAFVKDLLISLQFGAGAQTDAYFIANTISGFIFGGVFYTIGMVFLPAFQRAKLDGGKITATVYRTASVLYASVSAILGMITMAAADKFVEIMTPDLTKDTYELAVQMTRIVAMSFVFSGWVGLQSAVLQSYKKMIWPQVLQVINHLIVICGLGLAVWIDGRITMLVYAAVIGWIVTALIVSFRSYEFWPRGESRWFDRGVASSLLALSFPVFLSISLDQIGLLIGTYIAASHPEGAISHLNYAAKLITLLSTVFAMVISYIIFPYITDSILGSKGEQTKKIIAQAMISVLLISMPFFVISFFMGNELISLVFERGAFRSEDASTSGTILTYLSPIIVLAGIREVLNRVFLSKQQSYALLMFGTVAVLVSTIASFYFSSRIGLKGIALGMTSGAAAYVCAQISIIAIRNRELLHPDLIIWVVFITIASVISVIPIILIDDSLVTGSGMKFLAKSTASTLTFYILIVIITMASTRLSLLFKFKNK